MGKKDPRIPRAPISDEAGVYISGSGLFSAVSEIIVADLISEGEIEGLVSGEYVFEGKEGAIGYTTGQFVHYTALDSSGNCSKDLGFLRSVYWNEVPIVDKDGFYNFAEVNLNWNKGLPQGEMPALSSNLPNEENSKGNTDFELNVFRNIGERLFGPQIDLSKPELTPGYKRSQITGTPNNDYGKVFGKDSFGRLSDNPSNPPTLLGEIDRNAKIYTVLNKECVAVQVNLRIPRLLETIVDDPFDNVNVQRAGKRRQSFFDKKAKHKDAQLTFGNGDIRARKIRVQIYTRPIYDTRNITTTSNIANRDQLEQDLYVPWKPVPDIDHTIFGKIEEPYLKTLEINFKRGVWKNQFPRDSKRYKFFQGWEIKIVRLTPDSVQSYLKNQSFVDSLVEIYDSVVKYPYCAMVYSKFSAEFFSRIPSRAYETNLIKVQIPNTYDPIMRTYTEPDGYWDGCFKPFKAWTNNPAWCFYDLISNNRYGLGEYIDASALDKWSLYEIAKYCDVLVPDGRGGLEPRFTLNHIIVSREEAFKVVNDLASAFRALVYFANGSIYVSQDRPKQIIYLFNNSNVVDGAFSYSSSSKKARHTVAIVRYNDKNNLYQPAICYTEDQLGIQRYGIREIETSAIGCTSEGQAKRFGEWILKSELLQTETINFTAGTEGAYIRPGDVVGVYDQFRSDRKLAGRTVKVQEETSGFAPSGAFDNYERTNELGEFPITGNGIIIDQPLNFTPDREYKLSILTPTNYLNPVQITGSDCVETIQTTTEEKDSFVTKEVMVKVSSEEVTEAIQFNKLNPGAGKFLNDPIRVSDDRKQLSFYDGTGDGGNASTFTITSGNARFSSDGKSIIGTGQVTIKYVWDDDAFNVGRKALESITIKNVTWIQTDSETGTDLGITLVLSETTSNLFPETTEIIEPLDGDSTDDSIFTTERTFDVTSEKAQYSFSLDSYLQNSTNSSASQQAGFPKRVVIEDGDGNVLAQSKYIGAKSITALQMGGVRARDYNTLQQEKSNYAFVHGQKVFLPKAEYVFSSNRRNGDLFNCLDHYSTDSGVSAATKTLALEEIAYLDLQETPSSYQSEDVQDDGSLENFNKISKNLELVDKKRAISLNFEKPKDVTTLKIKVIHPITAFAASDELASSFSANPDTPFGVPGYYTAPADRPSTYKDRFRFVHLKKTHVYETVTEKVTETKVTETISNNSTNTDKSLTSADYPEIRKSQVQTVYFSGFQAIPFTGNYNSDFSVGGSGILTKILLDRPTQLAQGKTNYLNFTDYCITGYDNSSVVGDLMKGGSTGAYSSTYSNVNGSNLVWTIEPRYKDKTVNRNYTMDPELASGEMSTYKVINIEEEDHKYKISALESNNAVYSQDWSLVGYGGVPGGPAENIRVDEQDTGGDSKTPSKNTPDFEYNPSDEGACCVSIGNIKTCYSNLKRSECDELKGEFFKDESCVDIKNRGECTSDEEVTEPDPDPTPDAQERFMSLQYKIALDMSDFSPSQGLEDNIAQYYKIKLLKDSDVFGEATDQALEYYQSLEGMPSIASYEDKTDTYGEFYLKTEKLFFPNTSDALAGINCMGLIDDYCEYSEDYIKSKGFHVVEKVMPVVSDNISWDKTTTCNDPKENTQIAHFYNKEYSAANIKSGKIYWVAPPNEKYKVLIQHSLYTFPEFLRDDDGKPISIEEKHRATKDIRDIAFENLTNNTTSLEDETIKAYKEGCLCDADNSQKPFADINLDYIDGIVDKSISTKKIVKSYADFGKLNFCDRTNYETFDFTIFPKTTFKSEVQYKNVLEKGEDNLREYIYPGQYAVFTVTVSPEFDLDTGGDRLDCHDQEGYRFTFAFNLRDEPSVTNSTTCNLTPIFSADDPSDSNGFTTSNAPKLFDTPKNIQSQFFVENVDVEKGISASSYIPVQYPGKIYVTQDENGASVSDNRTECLYVGGFSNLDDDKKYEIKDTTPHQNQNARGIDTNPDGSSKLNPKFTFGSNMTATSEGLTMSSSYLAASECLETNFIEKSDGTVEKNIHILLGPSFRHTQIADNSSSLFFDGNIETDFRSDGPDGEPPVKKTIAKTPIHELFARD